MKIKSLLVLKQFRSIVTNHPISCLQETKHTIILWKLSRLVQEIKLHAEGLKKGTVCKINLKSNLNVTPHPVIIEGAVKRFGKEEEEEACDKHGSAAKAIAAYATATAAP